MTARSLAYDYTATGRGERFEGVHQRAQAR
jgi:hypothetical protein